MRWLVGLLIAGLLIGLISLVRKGEYLSNPSQWNRTIQKTSNTTTQETGEHREYTGVTSYEQTDVVGSQPMRTKMVGEAQGSLYGNVQQSYDSNATFSDGREYQGSFKDDTTYNLHVKETDGTEHDVEGTFPSTSTRR